MSVSVDPRTGSGELLRDLQRAGLPAVLRHLSSADFAFTGNGPAGLVRVGIERKTVSELLGCVHSSTRFDEQVAKLVKGYDHRWLLVEGTCLPEKNGILRHGRVVRSRHGEFLIVFREAGFGATRHLYENFTKFQFTKQIKTRLLRGQTASPEETVAWLAALYRWYQKPWKSHKSGYTVDETKPDEAILTPRTLKRRLANQLPGVAWDRSLKVDAYFPTIRSMFEADERQWQEALGIKNGKKLARSIVAAIRGEKDHR